MKYYMYLCPIVYFKPKSVIRAYLDFGSLEEWISFDFWFAMASCCGLKTDKCT